MDIITGAELRKLANVNEKPCVSIYLPTHRGGPQTRQDGVRYKNVLAEADQQLTQLGYRTPEIGQLLEPARALRNDDDYWQHLDAGLALFVSPSAMYAYRVPADLDEFVTVTDHFHLKPLFPVAANGETFYVLALSLKGVRLFRASRFTIAELPRGDIPKTMADALWYLERQRHLQGHTVDQGSRGQGEPGLHGHAADRDRSDEDVLHFLQAVDDGFRQMVGASRAPLVLAGVDSVVSTFRHASHYQHIVDKSVDGNVDHLGASDLHQKAWPIAKDLFDAARREAVSKYHSGVTPVTDVLAEAVSAARGGRVETIFVAEDEQRWGTFDADTLTVDEHEEYQPGDRDLLDIAAVDTLTHGGHVYALESSGIEADVVAAVMRY